MIITLTLSFLVALNFLLLIFSCNKTTKSNPIEKPTILKPSKISKTSIPTKKISSSPQLAPTGS